VCVCVCVCVCARMCMCAQGVKFDLSAKSATTKINASPSIAVHIRALTHTAINNTKSTYRMQLHVWPTFMYVLGTIYHTA